MRVFNVDLSLSDFAPPIFTRAIRRIRRPVKSQHRSAVAIPRSNSERVGSYSQYGEDLILDGLLNCKPHGVYIDIGASDPAFLSNTRRFYMRGWSGVNIEPDPEMFKVLCKDRPRDINLNIGIAGTKGELTYYNMSASQLSGFSKEAALISGEQNNEKMLSSRQVPVRPLADIFKEYLEGKIVDFASIDVEGFELEVLKSNDWAKYRPSLIIIETYFHGDEIAPFLNRRGYFPVFTNGTNSIFVENDFYH